MEIVKLPKKFREICYRVMDGHDGALAELETFVKYPHQVTAIKAEVAYFNGDWEKGLEYDMEILPYLNEWYYAIVGNEHRAAMVVSALKIGREKELSKSLTETLKIYREEYDNRPHSIKNILNMKLFLKNKILPYSNSEDSYYHIPESPIDLAKIKDKLKTLIKKKDINTSYGRLRLFYLTYQEGYPEDAIKTFEEINDGEMQRILMLMP